MSLVNSHWPLTSYIFSIPLHYHSLNHWMELPAKAATLTQFMLYSGLLYTDWTEHTLPVSRCKQPTPCFYQQVIVRIKVFNHCWVNTTLLLTDLLHIHSQTHSQTHTVWHTYTIYTRLRSRIFCNLREDVETTTPAYYLISQGQICSKTVQRKALCYILSLLF